MFVETEPFGDPVEDALIGLVRNEPVDIADRQVRLGDRALDGLGDLVHRVAEDLVALHADLADAVIAVEQPAFDVEQVDLGAVAAQVEAQYAGIGRRPLARRGLQHHGAGAVAEEDAGAAIGIVEELAHRLGADDQATSGGAARDEAVGDRQGIDEARAHGLDVEGGADRGADLLLHQGGGSRKGHVGCGGGDDDHVNIGGGLAGRFQRDLGGPGGHVRGRHALVDAIPLADAGALDDPFIGGVDHPREGFVGDDGFGQKAAHSGDRRSCYAHLGNLVRHRGSRYLHMPVRGRGFKL